MAYGIDECRRCGKSMPSAGPDAQARLEAALRRPPIMSEQKWRRQGWKACPTPYQIMHRLDGVCYQCKWALANRRFRHWKLFTALGGIAAVMFGLIYLFVSINF